MANLHNTQVQLNHCHIQDKILEIQPKRLVKYMEKD